MAMRRGDVFEAWVPFKESRTGEGKLRPVVVVGASPMGRYEDQVVLVAAISAVGTPLTGDVLIDEWRKLGMKKECWIRARRLYGIDPANVNQKRLGRIPDDVMNEVLDEIAHFFK